METKARCCISGLLGTVKIHISSLGTIELQNNKLVQKLLSFLCICFGCENCSGKLVKGDRKRKNKANESVLQLLFSLPSGKGAKLA